ncbi:folate-binding protein YgfZ [soil metagenome]
MTALFTIAHLADRAVVRVSGPDWRGFLQGLLTNDVETLATGAARFAALLTPQGRVLFDLFVVAQADGCLLDVAAEGREALIQRLTMYRLRAKVGIEASELRGFVALPFPLAGKGPGDGGVSAHAGQESANLETSPLTPPSPRPLPRRGEEGFWVVDPRLSALGYRGYGQFEVTTDQTAYNTHRLALGISETADWGSDKSYPIEADFDLLNGIDFQKGCFVGQETTSRMKRRGTIKSRMLPIVFDGTAPAHGSEILAGELRAGEVLSGMDGRAMALVRLDRIETAPLTVDSRPVRVEKPAWFQP